MRKQVPKNWQYECFRKANFRLELVVFIGRFVGDQHRPDRGDR
ncbi:MAG TPA: hypothetical protein VIH75_26685 [Candidatus Sulfotelmatobacter sp.]|jgi:hypothetical protein